MANTVADPFHRDVACAEKSCGKRFNQIANMRTHYKAHQ